MELRDVIIFFLFTLNNSNYLVGNAQQTDKEIVFTSPRRIKRLPQTEEAVINMVNEYVSTQTEKIKKLEEYLEEWKQDRDNRPLDRYSFISDPVNVFHLLKRLTIQWDEIIDVAKNNNAEQLLKELRENDTLEWPGMIDYYGIIDAILNIQMVNRYKATDLVNGQLGPISTNVRLTYEEAREFAKRALENMNYEAAIDWGITSIHKYKEEKINDYDSYMEDSYLVGFASTMEGEYKLAKQYLQPCYMYNKDDIKIKNVYEYVLKKLETDNPIEDTRDLMKRICSLSSYETFLQLKCKYNFENSAFLKIAPLKEETIMEDPKIILFHDVIYSKEIKSIINRGKKKLREEWTNENSKDKITLINGNLRMNEIVQLENDELKQLRVINERVKDMSALLNHSTQPFQIINYAVGGYYSEHFDVTSANAEEYIKKGRRLASIMFGLNTVKEGGSLVFPRINLKLDLKKGDALVWYNIKNTQVDDRLRHATCPILYGYKWELTNWIHETIEYD